MGRVSDRITNLFNNERNDVAVTYKHEPKCDAVVIASGNIDAVSEKNNIDQYKKNVCGTEG